MPDITWKPDPSCTSANRAETAVVDDYELVALDMPSKAHSAAFITWELYGPPDYKELIEWGECATFEEAKTKAVEALERISKD